MKTFDSQYYDFSYFADPAGKEFKKADGSLDRWGYRNPDGHWDGCAPIAKAWKDIFGLRQCEAGIDYSRVLDVGCGRGQFVTALRDIGVEAWGFDFSRYAIENPYTRCQKGWCMEWDATDRKGWPYGNNAFDLVLVLDLMEHIYIDDVDFVINEIYRVSKKWIFLQIAIINGGSGSGLHDKGYIIKKDQEIPIELEGIAVAGHVLVQDKNYWIEKLRRDGWKFREDLVQEFINMVPAPVIANWVKNAIIILEKG